MAEEKEYIAKTFLGLEQVLAEEIRTLGVDQPEVLNRAVKFKGNKAMLYRANLHLHTALKVLVPIKKFSCNNQDELYQAVYEYPWENLFNLYNTFVIDGVVNSHKFKHSHYAALKAKDAIVDRFRNKYNKRPSIDKNHPDFRINLHIFRDQCTLSLDSSGESLHKRGYKAKNVKAPLNEVLAAGMIRLTGWDKTSAFVDPMCGSGTLPIEAALIANDIAPGWYRNQFGFETWHDFDHLLFQELKNKSRPQPHQKPSIHGCDISRQAIETSSKNLLQAGLSKQVKLFEQSLAQYTPPQENQGVVIMNPPYDQKLKEKDILAFYKNIGDILKKKYEGYDVWIFSNHMEALKHIGLHPSSKSTLYNGPLECKFQKYSIYKGSLKKK